MYRSWGTRPPPAGRGCADRRGRKVCGAFYVGNTAFFKQYDRLHQDIHELVYCLGPGGRNRPSHRPESWSPEEDALGVRVAGMGSRASEDTTRSIVVHAAGAGNRIRILGSDGRIGQERLSITTGTRPVACNLGSPEGPARASR